MTFVLHSLVFFIYEMFIYFNARNMLESVDPFFKQITGLDRTTNSKSPETWMCWMMNKNFLSIIHLNAKK